MDQGKTVNKSIAGLISVGLLLAAGSAQAVPDQPKAWEKCAGVAQKGMNDCGSLDGSHGCAGYATSDNSPNEWVYVPQGTCKKLGGKVAKVKPAKGVDKS
ncbi:DUF2282 domain-containing protein [uncultured Ferrimonas sp.]|uniref:BufA1 family periplasmic bufferin-type metallophore n=1 Tax=uncultured Ferrimonas sp. TaxID=432640 RepID=UPI002614FF02|nr:DUF2282 domain-containing protein [uncultured Ferrimonas sp.]